LYYSEPAQFYCRIETKPALRSEEIFCSYLIPYVQDIRAILFFLKNTLLVKIQESNIVF
jgi:hypothetical protein